MTDRFESLESKVAEVLDRLHVLASQANGAEYFSLFTEDAVFIGTDSAERWPMALFKPYAQARFDTGTGWTYRAAERNVYIAPCRTAAWFDERLQHARGEARGSGVLLLQDGEWKIAQYHLCVPIPNDLLQPFCQIIGSGR